MLNQQPMSSKIGPTYQSCNEHFLRSIPIATKSAEKFRVKQGVTLLSICHGLSSAPQRISVLVCQGPHKLTVSCSNRSSHKTVANMGTIRSVLCSFHVTENLDARHSLVIVPFCSHSQRCMFTSDVALPLKFPK